MNHKKDFPIFKNSKNLIYLDNASTTQKPRQVIKSIVDSYETTNANIHRGIYDLSQKATRKYDDARALIAKFISASHEEIIFTRSTTESLNFLSYVLDSIIPEGKNEILLTEMEHHSNLVPWQQLARRKNMKLKFIKMKSDFTLDLQDAKNKITYKTAIVSITHVSNSLGTINPVKEIFEMAKRKNSMTILDAAQSAGHMKIDVKKIGCDFLAFSGHKVYGPTGIGVLYGKKDVLKIIPPFQFGGDMIKAVTFNGAEWNTIPERFEAGTQNIEGAIALGEAIRYVENIGLKKIEKHERELLAYALEEMKKVEGINVYNPGIKNSSGIISFNIKGVHSHDVISLLDDCEIAARGGHHCTMPLMKILGIPGTARVSFGIYNTKKDVDALVLALKKINGKFNGK